MTISSILIEGLTSRLYCSTTCLNAFQYNDLPSAVVTLRLTTYVIRLIIIKFYVR